MVWADHIEGEKQVRILIRLVVGLGFHAKNSKYITHKALDLVHEEVDLDTFMDEIKHMNQ
jgi:hypothetical protein